MAKAAKDSVSSPKKKATSMYFLSKKQKNARRDLLMGLQGNLQLAMPRSDAFPHQGKRGPSPYNLFMKTELAKVKEKEPSIAHKDAFKKAAANWASAPENPKNQAK
ncbi:hypothetical protein HDU86_007995 [Geranomyces michiganensis]|nr:hypothetical protein HDU86_007995 [Geranomyces michiganensis]